MPLVRAFSGLIYDPASAGPFERLTAPPYDVISPTDQDRYYADSPYNVVRLILGKDVQGDDADENKYTRAAAFLRSWERDGILRRTAPALFPYEFRFHLGGTHRALRGVIAEVGLEPWGGSIIPHERTLPGPIEDRLALLRRVGANLSPVYAVVAGPVPELSRFLDGVTEAAADREVSDEAGTRHRVWLASEGTEPVTEALSAQSLMIADGHHRYTVALAYREEMRRRFGPGPWDAMMMLIVDAATEGPPVLPIHRLATGPGSLRWDGEAVRDLAEVLASLDDDQLAYGSVHLERGEPIHKVATLAGSAPTVCALHDQVLDALQSIELRFVPDAVAAEQAVLSGQAAGAYLLPPTRVERVWDVVHAGKRLPQKSTYFWPKPRTGMVIRSMGPPSSSRPEGGAAAV